MHINSLALVLGYQLLPDGRPNDAFRASMALATHLLENELVSRVIVSGGHTRPEYESEADVGRKLVPVELQDRVWTEDRAMSTRQNLEFCRVKLAADGITFDKLTVVCAPLHEERARFLFERYWPETVDKIVFVKTDIRPTFRDVVVNKVIYLMTRADPDEKVFLRVKRWCLD